MDGHVRLDIAIDSQSSHYLFAAGYAILIYDYLLTLTDEITYIWPFGLSLPTSLFLIVRYLPFPWAALGIYHMSHETGIVLCRLLTAGQLLAQALTYIAATWLLTIRVLVLYPGRAWLRYFVYCSLIGTHIVTIVIGALSFVRIWPALSTNFCYSGRSQQLLGVALLALVPLETLLVVLQLHHNILLRKACRQAAEIATNLPMPYIVLPLVASGEWAGGRRMRSLSLLHAIYMSGSSYFVIILSVRLITGTILIIGAQSPFYHVTFVEYALTSSCISRLFLHLRRVARRPMEDGNSSDEQVHNVSLLSDLATPPFDYRLRNPRKRGQSERDPGDTSFGNTPEDLAEYEFTPQRTTKFVTFGEVEMR